MKGSVVAAIVGVLLAGQGCGADASPRADASAPFITYPTTAADEGFDGALLTGQLALDGKCLVVRSDNESYALAFAAGNAVWDGEDKAVGIGVGTFHLDDNVSVSGGTGPDISNPRCPGTEVWRVAPEGMSHP